MNKKHSVVTLGTFDGVHLAHQKMLKKTVALARKNGRVSCAITFSFPPRLFFKPSSEPVLLTTAAEKKWILQSLGIEKILILKFDKKLSKLSAEQFFLQYILKRCNARVVIVGYNFRFGKNQEGTIAVLKNLGKKYKVQILVMPQVKDSGGIPISSGRIREYLKEGNVSDAKALLGRPYWISGRVVKGKKLGHKLGFPTANLKVDALKLLPRGVYIILAQEHKSRPGSAPWKGLANIGSRPTVQRGTPKIIPEAHFFNCDKNLYGKTLDLFLIAYLRSEKKFSSLPMLKHALEKDKIKAMEYLNQRKI